MLSTKQISISIALGVFFWFVFAIAIQFTPMFFDQGIAQAALFVASIPVVWLLVSLLIFLASLSSSQILSGISVAAASASLCDGLAITWLGTLYGDNDLHIRLGAAYILWGVGLFLVTAFVRTEQVTKQNAAQTS